MATIYDIATDKKFCFYGNKIGFMEDPEILKLAVKLNMPQMQYVSNTITEHVYLEPADTDIFLEYLKGSPWQAVFDNNLQGLACTAEGDDLLTGWMDLKVFYNFLEDLRLEPTISKIVDTLQTSTSTWLALGVEEVMFDGYEIVDENILF